MMPVTFVKVQEYCLEERWQMVQGPQQRRSGKVQKGGLDLNYEMDQGEFNMWTQESKRQSWHHEKTVGSTQTSKGKIQRQLAAGLQMTTQS